MVSSPPCFCQDDDHRHQHEWQVIGCPRTLRKPNVAAPRRWMHVNSIPFYLRRTERSNVVVAVGSYHVSSIDYRTMNQSAHACHSKQGTSFNGSRSSLVARFAFDIESSRLFITSRHQYVNDSSSNLQTHPLPCHTSHHQRRAFRRGVTFLADTPLYRCTSISFV